MQATRFLPKEFLLLALSVRYAKGLIQIICNLHASSCSVLEQTWVRNCQPFFPKGMLELCLKRAERVPLLAHYIKLIATKMHLRLCACAQSTVQLGPVLEVYLREARMASEQNRARL